MKVWVVVFAGASPSIEAVFSTEALANRYIDRNRGRWTGWYDAFEVPLNPSQREDDERMHYKSEL